MSLPSRWGRRTLVVASMAVVRASMQACNSLPLVSRRASAVPGLSAPIAPTRAPTTVTIRVRAIRATPLDSVLKPVLRGERAYNGGSGGVRRQRQRWSWRSRLYRIDGTLSRTKHRTRGAWCIARGSSIMRGKKQRTAQDIHRLYPYP